MKTRVRTGGSNGRLLLGVALTVCVLGASSADARASAAVSPPRAPSAAAAQDGLPAELCSVLKKPVSVGTNYIIRLISRGRIRGSLAGTIFSSVGFQPWCKGSYSRLLKRLRRVNAQRPALTSQFGPFVFNLRATAVPSRIYANSSFFTVTWSEYPRSTILDRYYLLYSINEGAYRRVPGGRSIHLRRGFRVRFAVRVVNLRGQSSPYVYSLNYHT